MDWGMANRMAQLIQADGHCVFLPIDHGYFQGPTRKLEQPGKTIEPLLPYSDALFVTRGVLRSAIDPSNTKPIVLRVSGGTSMVGGDLANEGITTSMEEAVRLNVSAVGISVFILLNCEEIIQPSPVVFGPDHAIALRFDQLDRDLDALVGPPDRSGDDIADAKHARRLGGIGDPPVNRQRRIDGDNG